MKFSDIYGEAAEILGDLDTVILPKELILELIQASHVEETEYEIDEYGRSPSLIQPNIAATLNIAKYINDSYSQKEMEIRK